MKLKIKGKGHPSTGGWLVTDENGVEVLVERVRLDANSEKAVLDIRLFESFELDLELDAKFTCGHSATKIIDLDGKKVFLCERHLGSFLYLAQNGLFSSKFTISDAGKCPLYTCGTKTI